MRILNCTELLETVLPSRILEAAAIRRRIVLGAAGPAADLAGRYMTHLEKLVVEEERW
jgi:hypothetical protein